MIFQLFYWIIHKSNISTTPNLFESLYILIWVMFSSAVMVNIPWYFFFLTIWIIADRSVVYIHINLLFDCFFFLLNSLNVEPLDFFLASFSISRLALYSVGFFLLNLAGLEYLNKNVILPLSTYKAVSIIV